MSSTSENRPESDHVDFDQSAISWRSTAGGVPGRYSSGESNDCKPHATFVGSGSGDRAHSGMSLRSLRAMDGSDVLCHMLAVNLAAGCWLHTADRPEAIDEVVGSVI